jgi:nicotinamidase-related amidase
MKNALLVIDVQESFIYKPTKKIPLRIKRFLESHKFDFVFFFKFMNEENSNWVKVLKWKGMLRDSETKIVPELRSFLKKDNVFIKKTAFSVFNVRKFNLLLKKHRIGELFICGLDTHACVYVSALEAFSRGFDVKVIEDLCAASHGKEYHEAAIRMLKANLSKNTVIKSKDL